MDTLYLELLPIVIVLLIAASIVWATLKTGISPMISSRKARKTMLSLLEPEEGAELVDLGSGLGTVVIELAQKYPEHQVIGYELSWIPWFISVIRKRCLSLNNLKLYRKDYADANFTDGSILYCYLYPGGMLGLKNKLQTESPKTFFVVSNTFALPSYQPDECIRVDDIYRTPVYLYSWKPERIAKA